MLFEYADHRIEKSELPPELFAIENNLQPVWMLLPGAQLSGEIVSEAVGIGQITGSNFNSSPDTTSERLKALQGVWQDEQGDKDYYGYLVNVTVIYGDSDPVKIPAIRIRLSSVIAWNAGRITVS